MPNHAGSCLCGEVRFEIAGEFQSFFLCHCSRCRKDSGSAHGANLFSETARITWLSGRENIRTFQLPRTRHQKAFCMACGSALPREEMDGHLLVVPAGSLDGGLSMRPDAHICVASRADWDERLQDVVEIPGLPGER